MDLRKEWQQLHQQKFNYSPIDKERIMTAIHQESISTIENLKKRLKKRIKQYFWISAITIIAMILFFCLGSPILVAFLGVMLPLYAIVLIISWSFYRNIDAKIDATKPVLPFLKKQNQWIKNILTYEKMWRMLYGPIGICLASFAGFYYGDRDLLILLQRPISIILPMIATIAIAGSLEYYQLEKKNRSTFGFLMDNLENNIRQMEDLA